MRKTEDSIPAFHWPKLAAEAGSVDAIFQIGMMYFDEYHYFAKDVDRAAVILSEAAERGSDAAAYATG